MNRYERVLQILDESVGGPSAPVGAHGAFWRGLTRDQFVVRRIFGLPLIVIGSGATSNLVKSLKGETPFGSDTGNPDASFSRMPAGLPPVTDENIAFIQQWIDDGCPLDVVTASPEPTWRRTNAPVASSRTDDIWFLNPTVGWAVNSDGNILKTVDGGASWVVQQPAPGTYLRCVGFASADVGWVGTLTPSRRLLRTTDGGANWSRVSGLPSNAPVAVCGLSVVSDLVVFASGTNRPNDIPRMMKTTDGGSTWSAWDMSAHASVLIDTYFTDALHGWVAGGKSPDPTPTTRNKLKPVVLETLDGGATWTNRLAGQEAGFPLGEWGWKIQFLDSQTGFVSLENFTAGAILKTTDGGRTWTRLPINDAQGNANLEGIGFVNPQRGWVGGWGTADFSGGFSSETTDGGANWVNANHIGRFLNRFRFFGNPVHTGYASGDTVYKYTAEPPVDTPLSPATLTAAASSQRTLLPDSLISGSLGAAVIRMNIPMGVKRLSVFVWDRFGVEVGTIIDELHPTPGKRQFTWDTLDAQGTPVEAGNYIVRMLADATPSSSILTLSASKAHASIASDGTHRRPRTPDSIGKIAKLRTLEEIVRQPVKDLDWLRDALQLAIQLELATLPPYLTARWSIKGKSDPVATQIGTIQREEMHHFGLACNLLVAIGGVPRIADPQVVPAYPGPLPGNVRPGLEVVLRKLCKEQAAVFMEIEFPASGPVALLGGPPPPTIGDFYQSIRQAFEDLKPSLDTSRQVDFLDLIKVSTLAQVQDAIHLITVQGEGTSTSPEEAPGDLAHYYRFGEIYHGAAFVRNEQGEWSFSGPPVQLPAVHNMADIPRGGYTRADVPDLAIWELIERFDREYSEMLRLLEQAWTVDPYKLFDSLNQMFTMAATGRELMQLPLPDGSGNYGPCFRYVDAE